MVDKYKVKKLDDVLYNKIIYKNLFKTNFFKKIIF